MVVLRCVHVYFVFFFLSSKQFRILNAHEWHVTLHHHIIYSFSVACSLAHNTGNIWTWMLFRCIGKKAMAAFIYIPHSRNTHHNHKKNRIEKKSLTHARVTCAKTVDSNLILFKWLLPRVYLAKFFLYILFCILESATCV